MIAIEPATDHQPKLFKSRRHSRVKSRYMQHFSHNQNKGSFYTPKRNQMSFNTKSMIDTAQRQDILRSERVCRNFQDQTPARDALESKRRENEAMLDELEEPQTCTDILAQKH
jgi:hypothetical protein